MASGTSSLQAFLLRRMFCSEGGREEERARKGEGGKERVEMPGITYIARSSMRDQVIELYYYGA